MLVPRIAMAANCARSSADGAPVRRGPLLPWQVRDTGGMGGWVDH